MLETSFCWDCPRCKNINWEYCAREDEPYECDKCEVEFYLTFTVDVEGIQEAEELEEEPTRMITIGISKDQGKTWVRQEVNVRDLDPSTSVIKEGDWLEHNGFKFLVELNSALNRLQTKKITQGLTL